MKVCRKEKAEIAVKLRTSSQSGNVLVVSLVMASIIGVVLMSYLSLTSSQNVAITRSQSWNSTVPVIEAGVEEALTHLYHNAQGDLTANGWSQVDGATVGGVTLTGTQYKKERQIGEARYVVTISPPAAGTPVIYAEGLVPKPLSTNYLSRVVRVTTKRDGLFTRGLVAKGQITMNGNNVTVDSFDSADAAYSTGGQYDVSKRKANGDVATDSGLVNSLSQGNADIYGHVSTGPGGSIQVGVNGSAGDLAWVNGGNNGIEPGWSSSDMNVSFPDVQQPFTSAPAPATGSGAYNSYQYVISSSGNWEISGLAGSLLVRSNVNAVLLVTGPISQTGHDEIRIEPGGSLNLYMAGASASISGNGVVNQGGNATNFMYWGLPTNTQLKVAGNGSFKGVIYAPEASLEMKGGGSSSEDVVGAAVAGTVTMTGNFNFHYDENLARVGPPRAYVVASWNEL